MGKVLTLRREGKRMIDLQVTLALVAGSPAAEHAMGLDQYGRKPFRHSALEGLENLTTSRKRAFTEKTNIAGVAARYGLADVVRWKPRRVSASNI